jgi:hypothetical protein
MRRPDQRPLDLVSPLGLSHGDLRGLPRPLDGDPALHTRSRTTATTAPVELDLPKLYKTPVYH